MTKHEKRRVVAGGSEAEQVVRYLREHPEFLSEHPEVLEELEVPHTCGEAVSLVEYQVAAMRERNHELKQRLQQLVEYARENEELYGRLHGLTLELIECARVDDVFALLKQALVERFDGDAVSTHLFAAPRSPEDRGLAEFVHDPGEAGRLFAHAFEEGRPVCGRFSDEQMRYLFGEGHAHLGSAALLPLGARRPLGLVAMASIDPRRFHSAMGTVFLRQLAEVVERVIAPHVAREPV